METKHELQYEEVVLRMIMSDLKLSQVQINMLIDYQHNWRTYYDSLCDALYVLANRGSSKSLWITPFGQPYLAFSQRNADDRKVLCAEDIPVFEDDLKEQLEAALSIMQRMNVG